MMVFYSQSGHRAGHAELFGQYITIDFRDNYESFWALFYSWVRPKTLIFGMIDDSYIEFVCIALLRALFLRKTRGLFFRPQQCFQHKFVGNIKLVLFFFLRLVPFTFVTILLPTDINKRLRYVATDYIYDPEFWHLLDRKGESRVALSAEFEARLPSEKKIILVCGAIETHKGILFLLQVLRAFPQILDVANIVIAGRTANHLQSIDIRQKLISEGCLSFDSFIDDSDLAILYERASLVWCAYPPEYDQASGVFGTAIQNNRKVIIRGGSLLESFCLRENLGPVVLDFSSARRSGEVIYEALENSAPLVYDESKIRAWRAWSWTTLVPGFKE